MAHDDDDEISREAAALTDAYRRRAEPPPGAAERSWHALQQRIAKGEQDPLADRPLAEPPPRWRPYVIGLAVAAAVLLAVGLSPRTAEQTGVRGAIQALFDRITGAEQQAPVHTQRTAAHDSAGDITTPTPSPSAPDLVPPPPVSQDRAPEPGPSGQVQPPDSDLARQLAQVRAAGDAVRLGDGAAALAAADTYLRAHPAGTFAPEARLHRAAALCLLGHTEAAREAAAAFERDYPTSPLRPRVAAVCAP
jgi:hypothetical protein